MDEANTKLCTKCGVEKQVSDFFKKYGRPRSECKICSNQAQQKYKQNNPEKVKEINASYRELNKEKISQVQKEYREENRQLIRDRANEWTKENRDKRLKNSRAYYQDNKTDILRKGKEYYIANPEKRAAQEQRRRARKEDVTSDLTKSEWQSALEHFNHKCSYCGEVTEAFHQDHVIPLCKGGGYTASNIIPACPTCNCSKHANDMEVWFRGKSFFTEDALNRITDFITSCKKGGVS